MLSFIHLSPHLSPVMHTSAFSRSLSTLCYHTYMNIQGSCLCGAVTITSNKEQIAGIVQCFCTDCQKHLGNFAPWVVCEKESTQLEGPVRPYASSETSHRLSCETCGASIGKQPNEGPKILIAAGIFDQPLEIPVIKQVFTEDKQVWME